MSMILVTSGQGFFRRLANIRLMAATREVSSEVGIRDVEPTRGTLIIAADLDHHVESLDAVAGSEFVDDRIRRRD